MGTLKTTSKGLRTLNRSTERRVQDDKDSGGRVQSGNEPLGRVQDDNDSIDRFRDDDDSKAGSGMTLGSSILQETLRTIRTGSGSFRWKYEMMSSQKDVRKVAQKLDIFQAPISKQLVSKKAATPATYQSEHPLSSRRRRLREKHLSKETSSVNQSSGARPRIRLHKAASFRPSLFCANDTC
ncbi:unnamed protein product [Sphagnum tenellum]